MDGTVLWGEGGSMVGRPAAEWLAALESRAPGTRNALRLSGAARAIRRYVVRELPRRGAPIPPRRIARALRLDEADAARILADLEARLFFLVRNPAGEVAWAFPVTAAPTLHRLRLSSRLDHWENIFGA